MILWMSGEEMAGVSNFVRVASNDLETVVNRKLLKVKIETWKEWRVIFIRLPEEMRANYPESRRLNRKDAALDFRIAIDYEKSRVDDYDLQLELIVTALEQTLSYFRKAGISVEILEQIRKIIWVSAEELKRSKTQH